MNNQATSRTRRAFIATGVAAAGLLNAFGRRAVNLDIKGFSRAKNKFVDITSEDDDLPWGEVQQGLKEIGFAGWTTAEVGGGGLERLTTVRKQMEKALGLS